MFSEHRELALSVVSCLLPSSPLSPSPRPSLALLPSCLEQLGNLPRNTAVMGLPCAHVALVCPVLPCDRLGRVFERMALEAPKPAALSLAPVSSSTLLCSAPHTSLRRQGLAAFLAGLLGHPHERPPVWEEVV